MLTHAKWLVVAVMLVMGGGFVAQRALAQGRYGHGYTYHDGRYIGKRLQRMREALELSDAQVATARTILLKSRKQAIPLHAELRVAHLEMQEIFTQETVDKGALESTVQRIGELRQQLLRHRVNTRLELRALLTPEQQAKARTLAMDRIFDDRHYGMRHERGEYHRGRGMRHERGEHYGRHGMRHERGEYHRGRGMRHERGEYYRQ